MNLRNIVGNALFGIGLVSTLGSLPTCGYGCDKGTKAKDRIAEVKQYKEDIADCVLRHDIEECSGLIANYRQVMSNGYTIRALEDDVKSDNAYFLGVSMLVGGLVLAFAGANMTKDEKKEKD